MVEKNTPRKTRFKSIFFVPSRVFSIFQEGVYSVFLKDINYSKIVSRNVSEIGDCRETVFEETSTENPSADTCGFKFRSFFPESLGVNFYFFYYQYEQNENKTVLICFVSFPESMNYKFRWSLKTQKRKEPTRMLLFSTSRLWNFTNIFGMVIILSTLYRVQLSRKQLSDS